MTRKTVFFFISLNRLFDKTVADCRRLPSVSCRNNRTPVFAVRQLERYPRIGARTSQRPQYFWDWTLKKNCSH